MPNIYLRLPSVVCAYYRNHFEDAPGGHALKCDEPVVFSKFTQEYSVLTSGLRIQTGGSGNTPRCYSQMEWNNLMRGYRRNGECQVMKRNPTEWLTYLEICTLEGKKISQKSESFDFLCISLPPTVYLFGKQHRTNPSYVLLAEYAKKLQNLICLDFKRALVDWELSNNDYCIKPDMVIHRKDVNVLIRFLNKYDIPVSSDNTEMNSMRRQLQRWLQQAVLEYQGPVDFDIRYRDPKDKEIMVSTDGKRVLK